MREHKKRKRGYDRISLKPKEKEDSFELSDFFSYRQSKKICKLLGKEPIMVKKSNGYIKTNFEQAENESPQLRLSAKTLGKRKRK